MLLLMAFIMCTLCPVAGLRPFALSPWSMSYNFQRHSGVSSNINCNQLNTITVAEFITGISQLSQHKIGTTKKNSISRSLRVKGKETVSEYLPYITDGITKLASTADDLQISSICHALGQLGVSNSELVSSGAWAVIDKRLQSISAVRSPHTNEHDSPSNANAVLATLLKGLDGIQCRWSLLDVATRSSITHLLHAVLSQGPVSVLLLRSIVVHLGNLRVRLRDLPAPTQILLLSATMSLLERPSASYAHIIYAMGNMKITLLEHWDNAQVRRIKQHCTVSLSLTLPELRWKIICGMASTGLRWAQMDVNLRRGIEEHLRYYASTPSWQYRLREVENVLLALSRMQVLWTQLEPPTQSSLSVSISKAFKRMSPSSLCRIVGSLAQMQPQTAGLRLVDIITVTTPRLEHHAAQGGVQVATSETQQRIIYTFLSKQAARMSDWEKRSFASSLRALDRGEGLVETMGLSQCLQSANLRGASRGAQNLPESARASCDDVDSSNLVVKINAWSTKKLVEIQQGLAQVGPEQFSMVPNTLWLMTNNKISIEELQKSGAWQEVNDLIPRSIHTWLHDEIKVSMALNALTKLYAVGAGSEAPAALPSDGQYGPRVTKMAPLVEPTRRALVNCIMVALPSMGPRAVSNVIYFSSKLRHVLFPPDSGSSSNSGAAGSGDAELEDFLAVVVGAFFSNCEVMTGPGEFVNAFCAVVQLRDTPYRSNYLKSKRVSGSFEGYAGYNMARNDNYGRAAPLSSLVGPDRMFVLADACCLHAQHFNARDLSTLLGTLRSLPIQWNQLPTSVTRSLLVKTEELIDDMDPPSLSLLCLSLGVLAVRWDKDLPTLTRVKLRLRLVRYLPQQMTSKEVYWVLTGLGKMKGRWKDFPATMQIAIRSAVVRHTISSERPDADSHNQDHENLYKEDAAGPSARAVVALLKGMSSIQCSWADIASGGEGSERVSTQTKSALEKTIHRAVTQTAGEESTPTSRRTRLHKDDALFATLALFMRKVGYRISEASDAEVDLRKALLWRLAQYTSASNTRMGGATESGRWAGEYDQLLLDLTTMGISSAEIDQMSQQNAAVTGAQKSSSIESASPPALRPTFSGAQSAPLSRTVSSPVPAPNAHASGNPGASTNAALVSRLAARLPSLTDKDMLRSIYLLGNRKFPRELLRDSGVLGIMDSRIAAMFPEIEPVALVAVLGSMQKLSLTLDDLPLASRSIVSHLSALASTLDRRTLMAAIRGLHTLGVCWSDLTASQQQGFAAGLARAMTAKPNKLASLLAELRQFGVTWKTLHANIPIVLRYAVFRLFALVVQHEQYECGALGLEGPFGELGLDEGAANADFSLEVGGEVFTEIMAIGASWQMLGDKAACKVLQCMTVKMNSGAGLSQSEERAMKELASQAPGNLNLFSSGSGR